MALSYLGRWLKVEIWRTLLNEVVIGIELNILSIQTIQVRDVNSRERRVKKDNAVCYNKLYRPKRQAAH